MIPIERSSSSAFALCNDNMRRYQNITGNRSFMQIFRHFTWVKVNSVCMNTGYCTYVYIMSLFPRNQAFRGTFDTISWMLLKKMFEN